MNACAKTKKNIHSLKRHPRCLWMWRNPREKNKTKCQIDYITIDKSHWVPHIFCLVSRLNYTEKITISVNKWFTVKHTLVPIMRTTVFQWYVTLVNLRKLKETDAALIIHIPEWPEFEAAKWEWEWYTLRNALVKSANEIIGMKTRQRTQNGWEMKLSTLKRRQQTRPVHDTDIRYSIIKCEINATIQQRNSLTEKCAEHFK